jgi:uncharacterized protein (DUF433 family)
MDAVLIDPEILGGTPCFRGTRVPIDTLLDYLLHGYTIGYFLSQFPTVTRDQVRDFLESLKDQMPQLAAATVK